MAATVRTLIEEHAPWLLEPELGVCVVGSTALRTACDRVGVVGPETQDLDLSWALDVTAGAALLEKHGVFLKTTEANRLRGTLALKLAGTRIEITSLRTPTGDAPTGDAPTGKKPGAPIERVTPPTTDLRSRILTDLAGRDMTIGALAHWLSEDAILDPYDGVADWRDGIIRPVGDPADRIAEHPARWLRYYRRAHQWGFDLDPSIREVSTAPALLNRIPAEAIGSELRAALLTCASPGRFLDDLYRHGLLGEISEELALQFDGRPAGPLRHHPEGSQAHHMILALEWIVAHTSEFDERDQLAARVAVLCHDLGKGYTAVDVMPSHFGHEESGVEPLRRLLGKYPVLTDPSGKRLAEAVCTLHLTIRKLGELRAGTRARLYQRHFRDKNFRADLFALAIGADSGGRLGRSADGDIVAREVARGIQWMRDQASQVDVAAIYEAHKDDKERFQSEVHQAYARVMKHLPD